VTDASLVRLPALPRAARSMVSAFDAGSVFDPVSSFYSTRRLVNWPAFDAA
jgi:hypothetical protein